MRADASSAGRRGHSRAVGQTSPTWLTVVAADAQTLLERVSDRRSRIPAIAIAMFDTARAIGTAARYRRKPETVTAAARNAAIIRRARTIISNGWPDLL